MPPDATPSCDSPAPRSREELTRAISRPYALFEVVLASPERLAANAERGVHLGPLFAVLLLASTAFALPYGCVIGWGACWKVTALFLGSTLICVPSLHVFATYLGLRVSLSQLLVFALAIPSVAALVTFGFAPILGFLKLTMGDTGGDVPWERLSVFLLCGALLAGVGQLWRCLETAPAARSQRLLLLVLLAWHGVFFYVLARMATVLELW